MKIVKTGSERFICEKVLDIPETGEYLLKKAWKLTSGVINQIVPNKDGNPTLQYIEIEIVLPLCMTSKSEGTDLTIPKYDYIFGDFDTQKYREMIKARSIEMTRKNSGLIVAN